MKDNYFYFIRAAGVARPITLREADSATRRGDAGIDDDFVVVAYVKVPLLVVLSDGLSRGLMMIQAPCLMTFIWKNVYIRNDQLKLM